MDHAKHDGDLKRWHHQHNVVVREGGHPPQHHQAMMMHQDRGGAPAPTMQPRPCSLPSPSSVQNRQPPSSEGNSHARSHSSEKTAPRPMMSMDPTGMFRNRGRRVIGGNSNNNASVDGSGGEASPQESPSPPKNNHQRRRNPPDLPLIVSSQTNNNFIGSAQQKQQQQHELEKKVNFLTRHEQSDLPCGPQPQMNSKSEFSENIQFGSTSTQLLHQPYPLQSKHNESTPSPRHQMQQAYPLSSKKAAALRNDTENPVEAKEGDDGQNHVKNATKQEEPEMDHPPQLLLPDPNVNFSSDMPQINGGNAQKIPRDTDENNDDKLANVALDDSDSVDSERTRSTVGSTVSIMGSLVGEGTDQYDESRLSAVKRRMMQDVEEVLEEEDNDEGDPEEEKDENGEGERSNDDGNDENQSKNDSKIETLQQKDLEQTANTDDAMHESNNETLNVSLEVSFHNDTSFVDERHASASLSSDHPLNASFASFLGEHHPVNASFLDDYPMNGAIPEGDKALENDRAIEHNDSAVESEGSHPNMANNVVRVADFSKPKIDAIIKNDAIHNYRGQTNNNDLPPSKNNGESESPFRTAFRRGAWGATSKSNPQPPSPVTASAPSFESPKQRLPTPQKLVRAAATASLLAGRCFSYEDTTLDDDDYSGAPDMPRGEGVGGGGPHRLPTATTHKYYGLSAVHSFAGGKHDEGNSAVARTSPMRVTPHGQRRWQPHPRPHHTRSSSQPASPSRVVCHSQTWDHGDVRETSSFDPWSLPAGRRRVPPLGNRVGRQLNPFRIDESSSLINGQRRADGGGGRSSKEKDWKKIETERGDAIDLLACMVEQSLNLSPMGKEGSQQPLCDKYENKCDDKLSFEKIKLIAKSLKEINVDASENQQSFNEEEISRAIDTLLRSHEFALELKRSSLSAYKWLQSVGRTKNDNDTTTGTDDEFNLSLDVAALRARLHTAENTISRKEGEFRRLDEELSQCRAEIGRLRSSSRTQSQPEPMSVSLHQSLLTDSTSEDSTENKAERGAPLELCSPRPANKLRESSDDSFQNWEKDIEMQMNLESRKENLLLKAALENANRKIAALRKNGAHKKEEPFSSEIEPIQSDADDSEQLFMRIAEDIENEAVDTSFITQGDGSLNEDVDEIPSIKLDDPALEKALEEYRTALITSLRQDEINDSRPCANCIAPTVDANFAQDLSKSNSSEAPCSDRKMINVRMIDGENFSTEWGLDNTLPPPPDHGLHSPIVDTILSKWTDDPGTRSSLIGWIESILNGSSVDTTPSLKLSGLDHQIRDGFMMHVLPLLLRRKDVHIHLTSRAHRQTTYDIAVTVAPNSFGTRNNEYDKFSDPGSEDPELQHQHRHIPQESKHHLMAFQATRSGAYIENDDSQMISPTKHRPLLTKPLLGGSIPVLASSSSNAGSICTAVTSPISNRTPSRAPHFHGNKYTSLSEMKKGDAPFSRDHYAMPNLNSIASPSLGDELSGGSSAEDYTDSKHSQRQSTIMDSLSGAFGLLSRRKPPPAENKVPGAISNGNDVDPSMFQTPKRDAAQFVPKSSKEQEHSYHRVVSAPPGKIGITFVEYRGHAMVSNVSDESPLVGWVFPSDVLIAIDDVPVSGLRTREIVKLLTNRVKKQRSLRMVSAVAMNELTRPGTV